MTKTVLTSQNITTSWRWKHVWLNPQDKRWHIPFHHCSWLQLGSAVPFINLKVLKQKGGSIEGSTPIAGWFTTEHPKIQWMIWWYPYFRKPSYWSTSSYLQGGAPSNKFAYKPQQLVRYSYHKPQWNWSCLHHFSHLTNWGTTLL